jgi:hypothetical protein
MFEVVTRAYQSLVKVFTPVLLQRKIEKLAGIKKDVYLIDVETSFRCRYAVKCSEARLKKITAKDFDEDNSFIEFSQLYLGGEISNVTKLKDNVEYLKIFDEDNEYLEEWSNEDKLAFINEVNEE